MSKLCFDSRKTVWYDISLSRDSTRPRNAILCLEQSSDDDDTKTTKTIIMNFLTSSNYANWRYYLSQQPAWQREGLFKLSHVYQPMLRLVWLNSVVPPWLQSRNRTWIRSTYLGRDQMINFKIAQFPLKVAQKVDALSFYSKSYVFQNRPKSKLNTLAILLRKFDTKNFQKSPNLVTLLTRGLFRGRGALLDWIFVEPKARSLFEIGLIKLC